MSDTKLSRVQVAAVIRQMRADVKWKPGSATRHLKKRKARRHLPPAATLVDYNDIIRTVLSAPNAAVYVYWYKRRAYPSVATVIDGDYWLVMLSMDGFMESAYVVENPRAYLSWPDFEPLGSLSEVLA